MTKVVVTNDRSEHTSLECSAPSVSAVASRSYGWSAWREDGGQSTREAEHERIEQCRDGWWIRISDNERDDAHGQTARCDQRDYGDEDEGEFVVGHLAPLTALEGLALVLTNDPRAAHGINAHA